MVEGFVGLKRKSYFVHEQLLVKDSAYFRQMLLEAKKEELAKQIYLPEDDAETFELFLDWLYHNKLRPVTTKFT